MNNLSKRIADLETRQGNTVVLWKDAATTETEQAAKVSMINETSNGKVLVVGWRSAFTGDHS